MTKGATECGRLRGEGLITGQTPTLRRCDSNVETRIVSKGMTSGDVQAKMQRRHLNTGHNANLQPDLLYLAELVIYRLLLQQFDNICAVANSCMGQLLHSTIFTATQGSITCNCCDHNESGIVASSRAMTPSDWA